MVLMATPSTSFLLASYRGSRPGRQDDPVYQRLLGKQTHGWQSGAILQSGVATDVDALHILRVMLHGSGPSAWPTGADPETSCRRYWLPAPTEQVKLQHR